VCVYDRYEREGQDQFKFSVYFENSVDGYRRWVEIFLTLVTPNKPCDLSLFSVQFFTIPPGGITPQRIREI